MFNTRAVRPKCVSPRSRKRNGNLACAPTAALLLASVWQSPKKDEVVDDGAGVRATRIKGGSSRVQPLLGSTGLQICNEKVNSKVLAFRKFGGAEFALKLASPQVERVLRVGAKRLAWRRN